MSDADTTVGQLRKVVADFVAERRWQPYHDPKNLAMSIAIEAAELMEHFQWVRSDELSALLADQRRRSAVADELADVACYVLALANVMEIDLASTLRDKIAKNALKYPVERFCGRYFKPDNDGNAQSAT